MHKLMFKLKARLFLLLAAVYILVGLLSGVLFHYLIPEEYFASFPIIGVFYFVTGMIFNFVLDRSRNKHPDRLLNVFMLGKTTKFIITILFLILYVQFRPEIKLEFSISLMGYYFIYSMLEIYIYYLYNKSLIRRLNKNGTKDESETKK